MKVQGMIAVCLAWCILGGCARETRVIRYNPFLGGLPEAQSNTPVVRDLGDYQDPTALAPEELVKEAPDGKKTLVARSGRHLMVHIFNTLQNNEQELFVDQVLATRTKDECYERGVEPGAAFEFLKAREEDVRALFNMMPAGEQTPGVLMQPLGGKAQRVQIRGLGTQDLYWTGFDMVMEGGNWKLRWFVN